MIIATGARGQDTGKVCTLGCTGAARLQPVKHANKLITWLESVVIGLSMPDNVLSMTVVGPLQVPQLPLEEEKPMPCFPVHMPLST